MICEFGDVVIVPFPFVDAPAAKRRPSVVLSGRAFNEANGHSVFAMITTATRSRWLSDIAIGDIASAGLPHPCCVRWKLFTLPNALILKRAGGFALGDRGNLAAAIRRIFA